MKLLHGLVMTAVVLLCENTATGATRSLRETTSGRRLDIPGPDSSELSDSPHPPYPPKSPGYPGTNDNHYVK
ncbi:hypothetical protein KXD40_008276 [Peronospora effusa]|uniref:RxLR effector protein n=1 Tax=Peronospora effusa TaxID=542832 RepID=A0A3R8CNR6_9STRA|nr:hypothetical protein DD237_008590 [Peronospora effusa]UIZ24223.1 hypothetical protein KXD40_008276 [Peronospora effusa]